MILTSSDFSFPLLLHAGCGYMSKYLTTSIEPSLSVLLERWILCSYPS